jgi:uncharacterized membrane protein SirB2
MRDLIKSTSQADFFRALLVSLITIVVLMLVIRYIWNTVLTKYITILKPVDSLIDTLLLAVGFWILSN